MAFSLGLSSCQNGNCKTLTFSDTSLTWGTPGPELDEIIDASLNITTSSDNSVSFHVDITGFFLYEMIGRASGVLGGTIITGVGTTWLSNCAIGDTLIYNGTSNHIEIATIDSDTQITLVSPLLVAMTNDWVFNMSNPTSLQSNLIFNVISDDIGMSTDLALSDDVYNIVYTVADANYIYTYETNQLLYCAVECCVQHKVQQIPQYYECSTCDSTHILDALLSYSFLIALESAARCGSADELTNILNTLKKLCNYQPCIGCK